MSKNALQLQESLQVKVCYLIAARYSLAMEMHGDLKEALCYKLALEIHQAQPEVFFVSVFVSNQLYMTRDRQCHALPNVTSTVYNACSQSISLSPGLFHIKDIVTQLCAIAVTTCCAAASLADMPDIPRY